MKSPRPLWIAFLLSFAGNVYLVYRLQDKPAPVEVKASPKVLIDSNNFDFSGTGLSDDSATIPPPDLSPTPAPDAPLEIQLDQIPTR